jgi:hypothetical protein
LKGGKKPELDRCMFFPYRDSQANKRKKAYICTMTDLDEDENYDE